MTISRIDGMVAGMKLTLDARSGVNLIRSYRAGEIRVNEQLVHENCIVTADRVILGWGPGDAADLQMSDFDPVLELKPEIVLIGTGARQRFAPASVRSAFASRGIGLESMDLGGACRTFNILVQEERRVAAALFVA